MNEFMSANPYSSMIPVAFWSRHDMYDKSLKILSTASG